MKIEDRLQWLYKLRGKQIKLGLEPTRNFLHHLGLSKMPFPVIHIAGTNGKGSTAFFIYEILRAHGIYTGLYTSPHIELFNERIRINDECINNTTIQNFLNENESFIEQSEITFFETTTAMALAYFAKQKAEVAVIETGLGGRFDATNVVDPICAVITQIAKDHENFLGEDLKSIALEKLGIVKQGKEIFSSSQDESLSHVFAKYCREKNARLHWSIPSDIRIENLKTIFFWHGAEFQLRMPGIHQAHNACLALDVCQFYLDKSFSMMKSQNAINTAFWPGRIEVVSDQPLVVLDAAHNESGIRALLQTLQKIYPGKNWYGVMAVMADKKITPVLPLLAKQFKKIWCVDFDYHRALSANDLKNLLTFNHVNAEIFSMDNPARLFENLTPEDGLVIFGTHFILHDGRKMLKSIKI